MKYLGESVTGTKIGLRKRQRGLDASTVFWVLAWMLPDAQMNGGSSDVHAQWFSHWKIRADDHDVMRISHAIEGRNYKRRAQPNLRAVVWVFWYQAFGSINKPQTLYFSVSVPLMEKSIIRMECVTCLSICMYPDLSGEPSVSMTLVV